VARIKCPVPRKFPPPQGRNYTVCRMHCVTSKGHFVPDPNSACRFGAGPESASESAAR